MNFLWCQGFFYMKFDFKNGCKNDFNQSRQGGTNVLPPIFKIALKKLFHIDSKSKITSFFASLSRKF